MPKINEAKVKNTIKIKSPQKKKKKNNTKACQKQRHPKNK